MFFRNYNTLIALARPEALPLPAPASAAKERIQTAARLAMSRDLPAMSLSERLAEPAAWLRVQKGRRQALEALILAPDVDRAAQKRILDLICMIMEESTWSENAQAAPFDDEQHPQIDFQCAETLMLLAWAHHVLNDRLSVRVLNKIQYDARRRVFSPFLAHSDYPFMRFTGAPGSTAKRPLCILSDILLSAIVLESEAGRRAAVLKQVLRMLDQCVQFKDRNIAPLEDELAETAAVTDLCLLLKKLTRAEMDLTEIYPTSDWLDQLLFSWLEDGFFLDPAAADMRPALSGQEMFRVGLAANDEALTALGASLHRRGRRPSATVTGRLLDLSCESMLEAETGEVPLLKHAAAPNERVMLCRMDGMTCAMHTGGDRGNAGAIALFAGGTPVLVEVPGEASLPLIGGIGELTTPSLNAPESAFGAQICPADFQLREEREQMSVDLTRAWPARAGACSIQRTIMTLRRESTFQLVDAFDLDRPAAITFRFITPQAPKRTEQGLHLGPIELVWDGDLQIRITDLSTRFFIAPDQSMPLRCVSLTTQSPVSRGFFAFRFATVR